MFFVHYQEFGSWQLMAQMQDEMEKIIALHGTKEAPARTCKDLALAKQQLPSGNFKMVM